MQHRNTPLTPLKVIRYFFLILLSVVIILGSLLAFSAIRIMQEVPPIDPRIINKDLSETSSIYGLDGNLIEKVETAEYRTIIGIEKMPQSLRDAFTSIEDERFYSHIGIDPRALAASFRDTFVYGYTRGASTITQQLVKNAFLSPDRTLKRKLTEIVYALEVEKTFSKDQILEAYLNRVSLGQNAYGVQEAAQTYFSKNVEDLSILECAMLASIVKNPNIYPPFFRVLPKDFNPNTMYKIGQIELLGNHYYLVFNPENEKRAHLVLKQMLKLGKISQEQYDAAMSTDPRTILKPGVKKTTDITNYLTDFAIQSVQLDLMDKMGWSKERAQEEIFYGGLKIYSTIDVRLQKLLEESYKNFTNILLGETHRSKTPNFLDMKLDAYGNIVDANGNFVYLNKDNLIAQDGSIYFAPDEFSYDDAGNLLLQSVKLTAYRNNVDIADYYSIDDQNNLMSHIVGSLPIPEADFSVDQKKIRISKKTLDENPGLFQVREGYLYLDSHQVYMNREGVVQPQSAMVIMDPHNGYVLAMVGGRDQDGRRVYNRAINPRQPGSSIKPIGVYLPALDNGFTAASAIDDSPLVVGGKIWPQNWYLSYRGIQTIRYAVEQSINVTAVKVLQSIGIPTVKPYLEKMGIINVDHPDRDSFVTAAENHEHNDENPSSLALGGMTKGLSPLDITSAFGTFANGGQHQRAIVYTKVLDKDGNVLLENQLEPVEVVSPQVNYIMTDILRSVVTNGIGTTAAIPGQFVAGKTGTTQNTADLWFVGFTNHYVAGTWIGNDSPRVTMTKNSMVAAKFWQHVISQAIAPLEKMPDFPKPDGIVSASVCTQSGKAPSGLCGSDPRGTVRTEIFVKGTEPKETCDIHVEVEICTESGLLANEWCPSNTREKRVMIRRKPPYDLESHGGVAPTDFQYEAPTAYCNIHNAENTGIVDIIDGGSPDGTPPEVTTDPLHQKPSDNQTPKPEDNNPPATTGVDLFSP